MSMVPDLPVELHAEIVECLHHYRDRPTLLSAALVSKDWCASSQRVLFSAVTDHWCDNRHRESTIRSTHVQFLQTITEYPHRLGPLVRSYAQDSLACNPATWRMVGLPESIYELWVLTEKALPAMVNLKNLFFNPIADSRLASDRSMASRMVLTDLTFQLENLTWRLYVHQLDGFAEFLRTQHSLIHLEHGRYAHSLSLSWLEDSVCPRLASGSGGFNSLTHVARSRKITAWKWYPTRDVDLVSISTSALSSLKYLSVYSYKRCRNPIGPIDLSIHLLELEHGAEELQEITPLANLPTLRVLVLILGLYYTTTLEQKISEYAINCFDWLPSLEYMVLRYSRLHRKEFRYMKLSLLPGSRAEILQEKLDIHHDAAAAWWIPYNL